jgi:hypothetical protein
MGIIGGEASVEGRDLHDYVQTKYSEYIEREERKTRHEEERRHSEAEHEEDPR